MPFALQDADIDPLLLEPVSAGTVHKWLKVIESCIG